MFFRNLYRIIKEDNLEEFKNICCKNCINSIVIQDFNYRPIHISARHHAIKIMKYLIDNGANVCVETFTKSNLLHYALYKDDSDRFINLVGQCLPRSCNTPVIMDVNQITQLAIKTNSQLFLDYFYVIQEMEGIEFKLDYMHNKQRCKNVK